MVLGGCKVVCSLVPTNLQGLFAGKQCLNHGGSAMRVWLKGTGWLGGAFSACKVQTAHAYHCHAAHVYLLKKEIRIRSAILLEIRTLFVDAFVASPCLLLLFYCFPGLLMHPALFGKLCKAIAARYRQLGITKMIGFEARGFLFTQVCPR
eukprot:6206881-Pleurochrysis_carterae.AAC.2